MSPEIRTTTNIDDAANFLASAVLKQLRLDKRVLLFLSGGSSVEVGVKFSEFVRGYPHRNLTVMLADERYGMVDHPDSNWHQLIEKGFSMPQARILPILKGDNRATTTENFNKILHLEFTRSNYKIALFGIGKDGHTTGILPESGAVFSEDLAFAYDAPMFSRITITPKAIEKLDEAVVWMQGKEKWQIVEDLLKENISIIKQPAQVLKKIPLLTIFSDYQKT